jgi:hypothetical protein
MLKPYCLFDWAIRPDPWDSHPLRAPRWPLGAGTGPARGDGAGQDTERGL